MQAWLESVAPGYGPALMWTVFALIGLLILLVLIRIVRGLTFGTFVAGGRNRKARLAVMDATAVDSHRRLVLVRRDDVEHLILIGGPSDVVVEQNIRLVPQARRQAGEEPAPATPPRQQQPQPEAPAPRPAPAAPAVAHAPAAPRPQPLTAPRPPAPTPVAPPASPMPSVSPAAPASTPPLQQQPQREPRFSSLAPTPPPPVQPVSPAVAPPVQAMRPVTAVPQDQPAGRDIDDALLEELEVTLEEHKPAPPQAPEQSEAERSLDDEMSRLLSDLSGPKR